MHRRKFIDLLKLTSASVAGLGLASGARAAASRSSQELRQAFIDTLSAHDIKRFRTLYADNGYVQHQALVTNTPATPGGADAAASYFAKRIEAFPDLRVTSDVSLFSGDLISANLVYTGTHRGEYLGYAPTGKRVTFNSTDIMRVKDGLFIEHWGAADLYGLSQQLRS
jgi:predicted ester cyclase